MQIENYIIKNAQNRRQFDEYVSILMRYAILLNMSKLIVFTMIWIAFDREFRKRIRKLDKRTTIENFTRDFKNAIDYYADDVYKNNAIEIAFQREMKFNQKQIQNSERFDRYSKSYSESYSTNYFFKFQDSQSSRNWQTFSRNQYIFTLSQNRTQYFQQNQIFAVQNSSFSQRISQYFTRTTQYLMFFSAQKLLTNNANYNAFISTFYEQYEYNANSEYDEKSIQTINENIKFETFEHANFDDIIIFFHAKASKLEIFNDEIYTRHDMTSLFCNICKKSYFNNDDRVRLNNHMFNIHNVDIKSNQTMNRKRYINWMKHATLHVVTIRDFSSEREYVIMQTRFYIENNDEILICIDTESSVNFIDESFLSANNLWNRLHNCHSITIRDIVDERIVNKQINISLFVIIIDDSMKRIDYKVYVSKSIKVEIILDINELDKIENDIAIWLDRKKMQLNNCHVIINFTSKKNQFVIFFANATSRNDYTDFKSCFKSFDDKDSKKSMRFAEKMNHLSYQSICIFDVYSKIKTSRFILTIKTFNMSKNSANLLTKRIYVSENSSQIKSFKNEIFEATHDSKFANINIFVNCFANVFIFHSFFHQQFRWWTSIDVCHILTRSCAKISSWIKIRKIEIVVAISTISEENWTIDEKTNHFHISLHVLLVNFSMNELHVLVTRHNENVVIFFVRWHLLR